MSSEEATPGHNRDEESSERQSAEVRAYWNAHLHDASATNHPVGSAGFFRDLDDFRFTKLPYLPQRVDFTSFAGQDVLEVGCGAGIDLARFARGGARVTGVELAESALRLARTGFELDGLVGSFQVADGGMLPFADESFDLVYCHGVLQYAANPREIVREARRVLRSNGQAIFMVYNRHSWLAWMSRALKTPVEHRDAPIFRMYTTNELDELLSPFPERWIEPERFPQRTRLKRGWKAALYNQVIVPAIGLVPKRIIRPYGWHLMAYCRPADSGFRGGI